MLYRRGNYGVEKAVEQKSCRVEEWDNMKVLVIPDVHLKTWIFDKVENVLKSGKADRAVCLMDMPDD